MKEPEMFDERIPEILKHVSRLAYGNCSEYLLVSDRLDAIDGISAGLNQLCDVLQEKDCDRKDTQRRLEDVLRIVKQFATGDFEEKCSVSKRGDTIDDLAGTLNALVDELREDAAKSEQFLR